jgi:hypothetical protein
MGWVIDASRKIVSVFIGVCFSPLGAKLFKVFCTERCFRGHLRPHARPVGRQPSNRLFDPVEIADAVESLLGDRRAGGGMDVEEFATDMGPACVRRSPGKEEEV